MPTTDEDETPAPVAEEGHLVETERLLVALAILLTVTLLLGLGHWLRTGDGPGTFIRDGSFLGLAGATALALLVYLIRRLGTWAGTYDFVPAQSPNPKPLATEPTAGQTTTTQTTRSTHTETIHTTQVTTTRTTTEAEATTTHTTTRTTTARTTSPAAAGTNDQDCPEAATAPGPTTVICCSGGGVKSASFCLGGLQALTEAGVYQRAEAVTGVSGGGYAAAAFAVMGHRLWDATNCARKRPPFAPSSPELAALRRRTNVIARRGRVRFSLLTTLLAGLALNLVILGAFVVWLASIIAHYLVLTDEVKGDSGLRHWLGEGWYLIAPLGIFVCAMALILYPQVRTPGMEHQGQGRPSAVQRGGVLLRRGYQVLLGGPRPGREGSIRNLPATLAWVSVLLLICLVALPWALGLGQQGSGGEVQSRKSALVSPPMVIAALSAFAVSVRTTLREWSVPSIGGGTAAEVLKILRRHAAPWLASVVFVGLVFLMTVTTTSYLVGVVADDEVPWWVLVVPVAIPVALWAMGSTNGASAHRFYKARLAEAFLLHPDPDGDGTAEDLPLADLRHHEGSWPRLVMVATANVLEGDVLPTGRGGTPFIMSGEVGLTDQHLPQGQCLVPVEGYVPNWQSPLSIAQAVAVSGAAFTPTSGRESRMLAPYRLLLAFLNIRLGLWMRNPGYPLAEDSSMDPKVPRRRRAVLRINDWLDRPNALNVVAEAFGVMSVRSPYLYVSDGGHYDNLGLVEALRGRPERIIVLDGTGDDEDRFPVVGHAIATARMDHGVELEFDPSRITRGDRPFTRSGYVATSATYADQTKCTIVYVKCALPDGLSWDLTAYRLKNPTFPATLQRFEMFDEFDFEAFRHLGHSIVDEAIRSGAIT